MVMSENTSRRIYGTGIFTYIDPITINHQYTSPMDPMGFHCIFPWYYFMFTIFFHGLKIDFVEIDVSEFSQRHVFFLDQDASPTTWLWKCHASRGVDAILRSGPGEGKASAFVPCNSAHQQTNTINNNSI